MALFAQDKPVPRSENGWYLSPHGTIRILVLFVEIEFDKNPEKDPQPDGAAHWPKGRFPIWADRVFDPHPLPVQQADVSRYYQDISLGRYQVLGDYVDTLITLRESEYPEVHSVHSVGTLAVQEANELGTLRTKHRLTIGDFDHWKDNGKAGLPKAEGPDDPHRYDHVMVIVRNSGLRHGSGSTDAGSPGKLFGYESDTQSRFGAMNDLPFEILKHEFNHLLIGGNNFHSGGGNAAQFESNLLTLQGGWSMMGASGSSLLTCTGWDRLRLGWLPENAPYRINARDVSGVVRNGDIDPLAGDTGLYVLRDFVSTGDALRLRLPFIPKDRTQQWLWIENHQGHARNGSPTDRFHWEAANPCVPRMEPGLFMQIQIGREHNEGPDLFGGSADYLRPVLANGCFDLRLTGDTLRNTCPFGGTAVVHACDPERANPLSGNHEQELPIYESDGNGMVQRGEHWVPGARARGDGTFAQIMLGGQPDHGFTLHGNRVLGMCTNPCSANVMTLISTNTREVHGRRAPNVRTIHLNGIRVELVDMRDNGDALVRVSTNDTRMTSDQRWCADSIVLPPLRGVDGHSLTITRNTRLLLDRSLTANRMTAPDTTDGYPLFNDPTRLIVSPGASVFVEPGATLELRARSELHLLPGSTLSVARKGELRVERGSCIIVRDPADLRCKPRVLRKLRRQGSLRSPQ